MQHQRPNKPKGFRCFVSCWIQVLLCDHRFETMDLSSHCPCWGEIIFKPKLCISDNLTTLFKPCSRKSNAFFSRFIIWFWGEKKHRNPSISLSGLAITPQASFGKILAYCFRKNPDHLRGVRSFFVPLLDWIFEKNPTLNMNSGQTATPNR